MNRSPFTHLYLSAAFLEPLLVELSWLFVLSGDKLNRVFRPKHPGQAHSDGLKPLVKKDSIPLGIIRSDLVYGERKIYEPTPADRMKRTPAHLDLTVADSKP